MSPALFATNTNWIGNPSPKYDSSYRPGDNLYTNSALALDAATGKLRWYHQYTPNDTMDYDETGSHILIDTRINGEDRETVVRAARNGFAYSFDRLSGQFLKATQYVSKVTWTKGTIPRPASRSTTSQQGSADRRADHANGERRQSGLVRVPGKQFLVGGL
jgi:alcohol dehydrogenase (cytochrome c)